MQFDVIEGATPIDADEALGLIPKNILQQSELNEWEQSNILSGQIWLFQQKKTLNDFATIEFIKKCHFKMFDKTWRWAGKFRTSGKNIGVCWTQIQSQLRNLLDDLIFQINQNAYPLDELAIRFHHHLVCIHAFPNGNGRHARILTDYLLHLFGNAKFTWGNRELFSPSNIRKQYIAALKQADLGHYETLLQFAKNSQNDT